MKKAKKCAHCDGSGWMPVNRGYNHLTMYSMASPEPSAAVSMPCAFCRTTAMWQQVLRTMDERDSWELRAKDAETTRFAAFRGARMIAAGKRRWYLPKWIKQILIIIGA